MESKEGFGMEVAKITTKGQLTIPVDIRRKMNLKDGDKVIFLEQDGRYYIENASLVSITRAQEAFAGEAERLGLKDEQDVVDMIKEVRRTRREKR
jgi:AbrB family looped-hinge helix DNA binding protein